METLIGTLNENILKELECPVCLEYILPPIIMICNNGHNVCSTCSAKLQECPSCRSPVVRIKNVALENIARQIEYHCTNRKWGCNDSFPVDLIVQHQTICPQVPRSCPFKKIWAFQCTWKGALNTMKKHMVECHKKESIIIPDGETVDLFTDLNKDVELELEKILLTCNEMFYVRSGVKGENFYCVLRYIDLKDRSAKFKFEFSVKNPKSHESITITNLASSITAEVKDVMDSGKCVLIPFALIKNYIEIVPVYNLKYRMKITQVTS